MLSKEQVIEKARKLFRLGTNAGATEHERERAIAQGHKLLAKYNLDMASLATEPENPLAGHIHVKATYYMSPFTRAISNAIAKLYFCRYLYVRGTNEHLFVGEQANVTTAAGMAEFIVKALLKEGRDRFFISEDRTSFYYGVADAIFTRAAELVEQHRNMRQPGTALVLADVYSKQIALNDEYVKRNWGATGSRKTRSYNKLRRDAVNAGRAYGNGVQLSTNVEG